MTDSGEKIGEKIKRLRSFRGMTCAELAESIGCTRPYLSAVENGRYPASTKILRKLSGALNVNTEYFTTLGEPDLEDTTVYTKANLMKVGQAVSMVGAAGAASGTRRIPLVSLRETGETTVLFDSFPATADTDFFDCPADVTDANAFAISVEGESMTPVIPSGATVIVAPNLDVKEKRPVLVKFASGEVGCRIYQADGNKVILAPYNHGYPVAVHDASEIEWVYPVVKIIIDIYHGENLL